MNNELRYKILEKYSYERVTEDCDREQINALCRIGLMCSDGSLTYVGEIDLKLEREKRSSRLKRLVYDFLDSLW